MTIKANRSTTPENTIEVPLQTSFHVPIGSYHATIRSVSKRTKQAGPSSTPIVRFLFQVHVPDAKFEYLAKLDLKQDMNEGSDLWNVICRLIGRKTLQDCSGATFGLDRLAGISCDIQIEHVTDNAEEYDFPLVIVSDVREAGALVKVKEEEN